MDIKQGLIAGGIATAAAAAFGATVMAVAHADAKASGPDHQNSWSKISPGIVMGSFVGPVAALGGLSLVVGGSNRASSVGPVAVLVGLSAVAGASAVATQHLLG